MPATITPPDSRQAADRRFTARQADKPRAASDERELLEQLIRAGLSVGDAITRVCTAYGLTDSDVRARQWFDAALAKGADPVLEPAPAEPEGESEPDELAAIEQDARRRVGELEDARQRLALDALTDADAARELGEVEAALADTRAEIERVGLAASERERRGVESRERAAQDAAAAALAEADKLGTKLAAQAAKVDRAAQAFARETAVYASLHAQCHQALVAAGERNYGTGAAPTSPVAAALHFALREAGAPSLHGARFTRVAPLAGDAQ